MRQRACQGKTGGTGARGLKSVPAGICALQHFGPPEVPLRISDSAD